MKPRFPIPQRIKVCIALAAVSLLLTFGMIFLAAHLTGWREAVMFTAADKLIFVAAMAADAVLMLLYIIFVFAAARMSIMRSGLIQKRKAYFGADGKAAVYAGDDVWQQNGEIRALSYGKKGLKLLLVERRADGEWKAETMRFYDSVQEMEISLREEYGFEIQNRSDAAASGAPRAIRVSVEDSDLQ